MNKELNETLDEIVNLITEKAKRENRAAGDILEEVIRNIDKEEN